MALDIPDIPTLLVIAGIIFLFIAIVREVSGYMKTSIDEKRAKILGIAGIILLASGLITAAIGVFQPPPENNVIPTPLPTPTSTPDITVENISPSLFVMEKSTPTSREALKVEKREERIHITLKIIEGGEKKEYSYIIPFPSETMTETPEPTPTSIPTETTIPTPTPKPQTE
jgi:hypothetical protein